LAGGKLALDVVHRFPNGPVLAGGRLFTDALRLLQEMKQAIGIAARQGELKGAAIDTWGVDFGLLGRDDVLLGTPYHYRDSATDGMMDEAFKVVPRAEVFEQTGIQFMQLNTLFQLLAMVRAKSPLLDAAETLLLMPNLLSYWLCGVKGAEFTHATTTQCFDPRANDWARPMLDKLGIPTSIFPAVIPPGTVLGPLLPDIRDEIGSPAIPIIATASHDTAAAVAAVPASGEHHMFISSGTWSLAGVEVPAPIITDGSLRSNFTNEGRFGGGFRFLKNIMGLWLLEESRRTWAREGEELSYDDLGMLANQAPPFRCVIDPDDSSFLTPGDMPARIAAFCERTGQTPPASKGDVVRTVLESLALRYRWTTERIRELTGRAIDTIHIVGGGCQNKLLCRFAAEATGLPVVAGPIEATALGNLLVQAIATGELGSLGEAREIVRNTFELERYEPKPTADWDAAYARFRKVIGDPCSS
jgi:rhamnulokinase